MKAKIEQWKSVEAKGLTWLVSSNGRIRAPAHTTTFHRQRLGVAQTYEATFKERDLSPYITNRGYAEVATLQNGKRVKMSVHRLVAQAFSSGYEEALTVNHIDGNKTNNKPSNLEWVSLSRNVQHQWETGLADLRGEKNPHAKLTSKRVVYIRRLLAAGATPNSLAVIADVDPKVIYRIRDGASWPTVTARKPIKT